MRVEALDLDQANNLNDVATLILKMTELFRIFGIVSLEIGSRYWIWPVPESESSGQPPLVVYRSTPQYLVADSIAGIT